MSYIDVMIWVVEFLILHRGSVRSWGEFQNFNYEHFGAERNMQLMDTPS